MATRRERSVDPEIHRLKNRLRQQRYRARKREEKAKRDGQALLSSSLLTTGLPNATNNVPWVSSSNKMSLNREISGPTNGSTSAGLDNGDAYNRREVCSGNGAETESSQSKSVVRWQSEQKCNVNLVRTEAEEDMIIPSEHRQESHSQRVQMLSDASMSSHNIQDGQSAIPFDQVGPRRSHEEIMARRLKNRERQRRYRARKRLEAERIKNSSNVNPETVLPVETTTAGGIVTECVTRVPHKRNWKHDARRVHMLKEPVITPAPFSCVGDNKPIDLPSDKKEKPMSEDEFQSAHEVVSSTNSGSDGTMHGKEPEMPPPPISSTNDEKINDVQCENKEEKPMCRDDFQCSAQKGVSLQDSEYCGAMNPKEPEMSLAPISCMNEEKSSDVQCENKEENPLCGDEFHGSAHKGVSLQNPESCGVMHSKEPEKSPAPISSADEEEANDVQSENKEEKPTRGDEFQGSAQKGVRLQDPESCGAMHGKEPEISPAPISSAGEEKANDVQSENKEEKPMCVDEFQCSAHKGVNLQHSESSGPMHSKELEMSPAPISFAGEETTNDVQSENEEEKPMSEDELQSVHQDVSLKDFVSCGTMHGKEPEMSPAPISSANEEKTAAVYFESEEKPMSEDEFQSPAREGVSLTSSESRGAMQGKEPAEILPAPISSMNDERTRDVPLENMEDKPMSEDEFQPEHQVVNVNDSNSIDSAQARTDWKTEARDKTD